MDIKIIHPDRIGFPHVQADWSLLRLSPIGAVSMNRRKSWAPLALNDRRVPHTIAEGTPVALRKSEVGPALYAALDQTCHALWGHSWNSAVSEIFRINRRTTQRDRVSANLLPPRILTLIAYIASADDAIELAGSLQAIARYSVRFGNDERIVRNYWANAADIFFGQQDEIIGVRVSPSQVDQ